MKKRLSLLILIILMAIIAVACSTTKEIYEEYTDENISFKYPARWHINVQQGTDKTTSILLKRDLSEDSNFVLAMSLDFKGHITDTDELNRKLEEIFEDILGDIESIQSASVISYEDITIDGQPAKRLQREFKQPDLQMEEIYLRLKRDLSSYNEISTYLNAYKDVEGFIKEVKESPEQLQELKRILKESENIKEENHISLNRLITKVENRLKEKDYSILKGFDIGTYKENGMLYIIFHSDEKEYKEEIKAIEKMLDSIKFQEKRVAQ